MENRSGQVMKFRQHFGLYHVTVRQKKRHTEREGEGWREGGGGRQGP